MKRSNVQLHTNVLCVQLGNQVLTNSEIAVRLSYFELMAYRRVNPLLWKQDPGYQWTKEQLSQRNGPRGRANGALESLWRRRPDLEPMPPTTAPNPFEVEPARGAEGPPRRPRTTRGEDEAPSISDIVGGTETIDEQAEVVQANTDHDLLVIAPPGTGKTHVLIERVCYLIEKGEVDNPLEQMLVLSFTRSAVAEVRRRLAAKAEAGGRDAVQYVQIRTFDSLVTHLLRMDLDGSAIEVGYTKRIEQFNKLISNGGLPNARDALSRVRFLFVDEVQDLNGARARLVLNVAAIVSAIGGISMFLGDPAQAIYDYESDDYTSLRFLIDLGRGSYGAKAPIRTELKRYRRFDESMLEFVREARSAMGEDEPAIPDGAQFDELLRGLERLPISELPSRARSGQDTAVLVRDNLQAYCIWDWLRSKGIAASLWRGTNGNYWPGWVGRLFVGFQSSSISIDKARQRWLTDISPFIPITFDEALGEFERLGVVDARSGSIRCADVSELVRGSAPPSKARKKGEFVISTIHRSKGLEFDDVLLLSPQLLKTSEEFRVVYVAATRARRSLQLLEHDDSVLLRGYKKGRPPETTNFHLPSFPATPQIGLLVDGADAIEPASILRLPDPLASQKHLWMQAAGRNRNLELTTMSATIAGQTIGGLNQELSVDIMRICGARNVSGPILQGLTVMDLATVALDPFEARDRGQLGTAALAIVPVVTGITAI